MTDGVFSEPVLLKEDDRFNVARLGEHVERLNPRDTVSVVCKRPEITGKRGGVAGHVNYLVGIEPAQCGESFLSQAYPRRID